MASRGLWRYMSARTRRSLALSWSVLFVLSLVLQYFTFATAQPVLAVHNEGVFELEGDASASGAPGDDWSQVFAGTSGAAATTFQTDTLNRRFTGGSKDTLDVDEWAWDSQSSPDKDDILHAYAAQYENGGDEITVFGLDRFANNGDANVGFWFFQSPIGINANGTFSGQHTDGDVFIVSEFDSGGQVSTIVLYKWQSGGLVQVVSGVECSGAGSDDICAIANGGNAAAPWSYTPKQGSAGTFPVASFFEGGADFGAIFGSALPCFTTFLAETRSSTSTTAELKNFLLGEFNTCVPPTIATASSVSTADFGQSVTDTATLSGNDGPASGTVTFFVCTPAQLTGGACPTGGSQVGGPVAVTTSANGGTATSAAYTVGLTAAAAGKYCWRAVYTPDASSQYLAGSHTNSTTECFTVAPATIDIAKSANPAGPVSAGDAIGFDVTVTNTGTTTTLGISVSDPLPAGIDWSMSAPTGSTSGLSCAITGSVGSEVLGCTKPSLAAGQSFTVHVSGTTDAADCGTVSNTASVSTTNDGTDQATATVTVQCPDVTVAKTPDGGQVNAGGTATFQIVVSNAGPGTATNVTLSDELPAGVDWSEDSAFCSISGPVGDEVLNCNFGTLAATESRTVNVSGLTDRADCGTIPNLATVAASNEATAQTSNNSDPGSIDVLCAEVGILKTANPIGPVNAGDEIGFDITVTNSGNGTATDVHVTDSLPAGVDWVLGAISGDTTGVTCQISGAVGSETLTCDDGSMAAGDSFSVHVAAATDASDCGTITNSATVSSGNDGGGSSSASVVVRCPDLEVVKSGNGPLNAGDDAVFSIVVTNHGPGAAYDVTLSDQLPAGAWTLGGPDAGACSINGSNLLTCAFGDLADDASRTITLTKATTADDCGTIHNEVSVSASNENTATDQFPNSDDADIAVSCPDLAVSKAGNGPLSAGEVAIFTITLTNLGPGTAYDVTLSDQLPAGTWTLGGADAAACSIDGSNLLSCDFGDLADDASRTITVSKTTVADDCGTVLNEVSVGASNEAQDDLDNNTDDASIAVSCPDVTVVKTGNGTISAGEVASFSITITNLGPGTAFGVTLSDQLPAGAWTLGGANAADCSIDGSNLLSCDFGTLLDDASRTVTVSRETDAADCGEIDNTALVAASNEADEDTGNNESSDTVTVDCPAIVITKTADDPVVNSGDEIGFTITVTNTGDGSAFGVTVSDTLSAIAGLGWSIESQTGGWSIGSGTLSFGPATLASGASTSVHIVSDTTADSCGDVPNLASVVFNGGSGSDDSVVTVLCPDIEVVKSASNSPISAGEDAVFAITVSNVGEGAADDVVLTDDLPAGIAWTDDSDLCEISSGTLTCELGTLEPGAMFTVHVSGPTNNSSAEDNDCGEILNLGSASASNEADGDTDNNDDDASIVVNCPDIAVEKVAVESPIAVGEDAVFQITVSNGGAGTAFDVLLVDELPAGLDWTDDSDLCEIASGTLTCDLGDMAPGATFTVTLTAPTIDEGAGSADCGTLDNTAFADATNESDDDLGDNEDGASIVVECESALTIVKTFTGNSGGDDPVLGVPMAKLGDTLHFTLTYTGVGPITNGVITDVLPEGLEYVDGSAEGDANFGFVDYDDATRTLTWMTDAGVTLDSPSGAVTYDTLVLEEAPEEVQPLVNVAVIDSDETEPDDDDKAVAVVAPPLELTPPPTSTVTPTQTTSNPGFALMLILLAIAAVAISVGYVTPVPERARRARR